MPAKSYRIALLLILLLGAVALLYTGRLPPKPTWDQPLKVIIYPYNADKSEVAQRFIDTLGPDTYQPISDFMMEQAARYDVPVERPFKLELGPQIELAPALPPSSRNFLTRLRWGLALRWWHFRFRGHSNNPDIIVIARYLDPDNQPQMLHSVAIAEHRVALTKLLASQQEYQNSHSLVVMAHEILHTVGASDLYDRSSGIPRYPEGFADPERVPRYPQERAELMAPRIPISPYQEHEADSLDLVVIGSVTAGEIGWIRSRSPE